MTTEPIEPAELAAITRQNAIRTGMSRPIVDDAGRPIARKSFEESR